MFEGSALSNIPDDPAPFAKILYPVLIITSDSDAAHPQACAEKLRAMLVNAKVDLRVLKGSLFRPTNHGSITKAIDTFVSRVLQH